MLNVAICDDDRATLEFNRKIINNYLNEKKIEHTIYPYNNGERLLKENIRFDFVFLDIDMPNMDGIEVIKKIKERYCNTVCVFVTSYQHYMNDALMLQPHGYLSKPLEKNSFKKYFDKLIKVDMTTNRFVYAKTNDGTEKVNTRDIIYAAIEGRKVHLHTVEKDIETNELLGYWKKELAENCFYQVHQSHIINMRFIKTIVDRNLSVILSYHDFLSNKNKEIELVISTRKFAAFKKAYHNYIGLNI